MNLEQHQLAIAARIKAHSDLVGITVIVEAAVPDVQAAVTNSLQKGLQCVVVALGGGSPAGDDHESQALVLAERFVITVGQVPGLAKPKFSPVQIIDRLIPWLHYHGWEDEAGGGFYVVQGHAPLDGDSGVSGHQLTIKTRVPVLS